MDNNLSSITNVEEETLGKAKWLSSKIQESITAIGRKKKRNKLRASIIKISLLLMSGCATILLGLNLAGHELVFKNIAFIFSVLVTLLTALEPFFNYRSLWIEHEQAQAKFYRLNDRLCFYLEGKNKADISFTEIESINNDYQVIWIELSKQWIKERRSGSEKINQIIEGNEING